MAGAMVPLPELGASLKAARLARRWSLSDLAEATGLSSSFISLVENGKSDISLGRLASLMDALEMSFVDFTDPGWRARVAPSGTGPFTTLLRADRPHLTAPSGVDVDLLIRSEERKINRFVMTYPPGAGLDLNDYQGTRNAHECFQLLLKGSLVLEGPDRERVELRTGDSVVARLDANIHCFNPSRRATEVYMEFPLH